VAARRQAGPTPATELLTALLDELQRRGVEQAFRLFHILEPTQQFQFIYDGLTGKDQKAKASSRELASHVVPEALRDVIFALLEDARPHKRLQAAIAFYDPPGRDAMERALTQLKADENDGDAMRALDAAYTKVLRAMLGASSDTLRGLTSYHVAELGMSALRPEVKSAAASPSATLADVASSALELLDLQPELSSAG
jgi:hypothetical protein